MFNYIFINYSIVRVIFCYTILLEYVTYNII